MAEAFSVASPMVGASVGFSYPLDSSFEHKTPSVDESVTAPHEFKGQIPTLQFLQERFPEIALRRLRDITNAVNQNLEKVTQAFALNSRLIRQDIPIKRGSVIFVRHDNQIYADLREKIQTGAEKNICVWLDLVWARPVVVVIPTHVGMKNVERQRKAWAREFDLMIRMGRSEHFPEVYGVVPMAQETPLEGNVEYAVVQKKYAEDCFAWRAKAEDLSDTQKNKAFRQAAQAISVWHREHGAHRDIRPENYLLDTERNLVLTDLQVSATKADIETWAFPGTPSYVAPEVWKRLEQFFKTGTSEHCNRPVDVEFFQRSDIWGLGLTFFIIEVASMPAFSFALGELKVDMATPKGRAEMWQTASEVRTSIEDPSAFRRMVQDSLEQWGGIDPVRIELILDCLNPDPTKRPTIQEVLKRLEEAPAASVPAAASEIDGEG